MCVFSEPQQSHTLTLIGSPVERSLILSLALVFEKSILEAATEPSAQVEHQHQQSSGRDLSSVGASHEAAI